jgi:hypothetical protein
MPGRIATAALITSETTTIFGFLLKLPRSPLKAPLRVKLTSCYKLTMIVHFSFTSTPSPEYLNYPLFRPFARHTT